MPIIKDLTGQRFGRLIVLEQIKPSGKNSKWLCRCDCGKEIINTRPNLKRGQKSCGCATPKPKPPPLKFDIQRKKTNNLTAIKPCGGKYSMWLVKCICGKEFKIQKADFTLEKRKSCGCIKPNHKMSINHFMNKVEKTDSCWFWKGSMNPITGYGQCGFNGKNRTSHRVSWMLHIGEIPKDKILCHKCDNKLCVNPSHMYIGTHATNMLDRVERNFNSFKKVKKCP